MRFDAVILPLDCERQGNDEIFKKKNKKATVETTATTTRR
jgi:hypothetical protein